MSTRILSFDTATEACSVALWNNGEITRLYELAPQTHAKRILPMIEQLLSESGLILQQLDAIAFTQGPGSFTGVRIGMGIAQGLAFGANLPVLPQSTLMVLAEGASRLTGSNNILSAIDARMNEIYFAAFHRESESSKWFYTINERVIPPDLSMLESLLIKKRWYSAGSGWENHPQLRQAITDKITHSALLYSTAEDMLSLAIRDYNEGKLRSIFDVEPIYLRNEVTWSKLVGK